MVQIKDKFWLLLGLFWWSSGLDSVLPVWGPWVQSLVGKLRSNMPGAVQPKKKKKGLGTSTFRWCLKSGEGEIREGMLCRHMGKRPKTELSGALMLRDWAHEEEPSDETCRSGQQRRQCSERMVPWRQSDGLPQLCASSCFQTLTASVCPAPHEMMGVPRASFPNTGGNQVSPAKKCDGKST